MLWILLVLQSLNTLGSQATVRRAIFQDIRASWQPFPHNSSVLKDRFPKQERQGSGKPRQPLSNLSHWRCPGAIESPAAGLPEDGGILWVPSQQQGSLLLVSPHPLALRAGSGKRPQLSILSPHSFSHLFPVLRIFCALIFHSWQSELTPYPSGNKLLLSGTTEEHPFTPFSMLLPSFYVLLAALSSGLTSPPWHTHQSVSFSLPESQPGFLGSFQEMWL